MYKIIGADQKEYGPVSADLIRKWIAEGRANASTKVLPEGASDWRPLSEIPEFAVSLGVSASVPPPLFAGLPPAAQVQAPIEEVLQRDYSLDIGACLSNGWELLTNNFNVIFVGFLIYLGIELVISLFAMIPIIGPIFSLVNVLLAGPLEGGLFFLLLKAIRRQPGGPGDVFEGFRSSFLNLFLGKLVSGLLAGLCLIPAGIVALLVLGLPILLHHQQQIHPAQILIIVAIFLVCMAPMMFLQTNWIFTLALIIDRRMSFWPAMAASWKVVMKHWWQVFALVILVALLNIVGMALCCVGMLFTLPVGFGALMYAYETIFSAPGRQVR